MHKLSLLLGSTLKMSKRKAASRLQGSYGTALSQKTRWNKLSSYLVQKLALEDKISDIFFQIYYNKGYPV